MNFKKLEKVINIPSNILIKQENNYYYISGPKGIIKHKLHELLSINIKENNLYIFFNGKILKKKEYSNILSLINTTYALFKNYIYGVLNYFSCKLKLNGIGYKAKYKDKILYLQLGYSHTVEFNIPEDIKIDIPDQSNIVIQGVSKYKVGQIAFAIKEKRMPEIYKGNGIRYEKEIIKLKLPKKSK